MTFHEAVSTCLSKYAVFSGRASRAEYWKFSLVTGLAFLVAAVLGDVTRTALFVVVLLATYVPSLAATVRRLHDTGRSGAWYLICGAPFGGIVLLVFLCDDSQPGDNRYGAGPRQDGYWLLPQVGREPLGTLREEDLPFYEARRNAHLSDVIKKPYGSNEPPLDPAKVDAYFDRVARGLPEHADAPSAPTHPLTQRPLALVVAGAFTVLAAVGVFALVGGLNGQLVGTSPSPVPPPDIGQARLMPPSGVSPSPVPTSHAAAPTSAAEASPAASPARIAPGDLGLATPLRLVACSGRFIVIYHSSVVPGSYARDVQANLASHPGSHYLLTLGSCSSLAQASNAGTRIYGVYGGPYDTLDQACAAASLFPQEAYVKVLDDTTPPDHSVRHCGGTQ